MDETFYGNVNAIFLFLQESSIIDVWEGPKYTFDYSPIEIF